MDHPLKEIFGFSIGKMNFAIPLETVDRILLAVAVSPLPDGPPWIHGLIDFHGEILPVLNLRYKLRLPEEHVRASDIMIIACTPRRKIVLVADSATGVISPGDEEIVDSAMIDSGIAATGILRWKDGVFFIYDMERFMSQEEETELFNMIEDQTTKNS